MSRCKAAVSIAVATTILTLGCGGGTEKKATGSDSPYVKCLSRGQDGSCTAYNPSLIELIVHPDWYEGRKVIVAGVLSTKTEDQALYVSTEDLQHMNTGASVWIDAEKTCRDCPNLDGQWVQVVGVFSSEIAQSSCRGGFVRGAGVGRFDVNRDGPPRPLPPPR